MRKHKRRESGFSLIELLIVVAIILVIAAIAIPSLQRARVSANESSAVASLRTINSAETTYSLTYSSGYAPTIAALGGTAPCTSSPTSACLIDDTLSSGVKSGYNFIANGAYPDGSGLYTGYWASTAPVSYGSTGIRRWCIMADGVIRERPNVATSSVPLTLAQCETASAMVE